LAALFLFFQAQGSAPLFPPPDPATPTLPPSGIALYFTQPEAGGISAHAAGIEAALTSALDEARRSVDLAVYHIDLESIQEALVRAHRRGVVVRVVVESDNVLEPVIEALGTAGIPVLGDRREGLMHHKFIVIDREQVWTGSMNLTRNDIGRNDNNLVRLFSAELGADYRTEFDEMWADRFGTDSLGDTPYPVLTLNGVPAEVYFSPEDGVAQRIVSLILSATRRVDFLAFSFTSGEIAQAILDRAAAGVSVRGVMDSSQAQGSGTEYDSLREAGIMVRLDGNPGLMHHKLILIDDRAVLTGSYNFSRNAEERNDENALILFDAGLVSRFDQEVTRVFDLASP
jgi:phosphatidylserine/phosphatidylglycerophosphate/cardiolipin synthase-like enzyme